MRFLPFLFLFLISCSDNILYNEATSHIFIDVLNSLDTISVKKDTVLYFQARINPSPEDVMEFSWIIENESYSNSLLLKKKFGRDGFYNVKFYAKDRFYDEHEINLFVRVSSTPNCGNGLSLDTIIQGSPIFKWNCVNDSLTYRFLLYDKYERLLTDTTLTKNSLQLGYPLQERDTTFLIVTNKYGIDTSYVWGLP